MNWEVEKVLSDQTIVPQVVKFIRQYKTKQEAQTNARKTVMTKSSRRTANVPDLFRIVEKVLSG